MFVDFLNLKKTDQPPTYPPLFENTTQKVKKRKKVPLTQLKNHQKALKPQKSNQLRVDVFHPQKNCFPARRCVYRSGIVLFHALEGSTARESKNLTRGNVPPLRNHGISRAVTFHRSGIAESHALEGSTAQKSQNPKRGSIPPPRNRKISRIGWFRCTRTVIKNLIE